MKNLEKLFMILAFICALVSMITSIYLGESWVWQSITMLWISVTYMKHITIERIEKIIKN